MVFLNSKSKSDSEISEKGKLPKAAYFMMKVRLEAFYLKSSKKGQNLKFQSINFFLTCIFSVLRKKGIKYTAEKLNKKIQITVSSDKYSRLPKNVYFLQKQRKVKMPTFDYCFQ